MLSQFLEIKKLQVLIKFWLKINFNSLSFVTVGRVSNIHHNFINYEKLVGIGFSDEGLLFVGHKKSRDHPHGGVKVEVHPLQHNKSMGLTYERNKN
jgi:hypothetical protein